MSRLEIEKMIEDNNHQIKKIKQENLELERQSYLISDEKQWYIEEIEEIEEYVQKQGRKQNVIEKLVGRIHWNEEFIDEDDSNSKVIIERSRAVKINGNWI